MIDEMTLHQSAELNIERIPGKTTILNFRRLLQERELAAATLVAINGSLVNRGLYLRRCAIVDATLINALKSTRIKETMNNAVSTTISANVPFTGNCLSAAPLLAPSEF